MDIPDNALSIIVKKDGQLIAGKTVRLPEQDFTKEQFSDILKLYVEQINDLI
jgi:hypothetical protein